MVKKNPLRAVLMLSGVLIAIVVIAVSSILAIGLYYRSSLAPAVNLPRMSPNLSNLPRTEVCWVETGHAFGSGPLSMTASGLLIRHPKGDVLIDGGNSSHFDDETSRFPFWQRLVMVAIPGRLRPRITLRDALRAVGESPGRIQWLVPSHIHLDHVGGYEDLPRIPVLLSAAELRFATDTEAQNAS